MSRLLAADKRDDLINEVQSRAAFQAQIIEFLGIEFALWCWQQASPSTWWCSSSFEELVAENLTLPDVPDVDTFAERMVTGPWQLSNAQAEFDCDQLRGQDA